jgi:hypothetical protein
MRRRAGEHQQNGRSGDQEVAGGSDPERRIDAEGNTGDHGNTRGENARSAVDAPNSASYPQCCPNCEGVLAAGVLYGFPILECRFDRQKISRVAVVGMLLDGGVSPRKTAAPCGSNRILGENLRQRVRELTVNCRNAGAHDRLRLERVRPFASAPRHGE